MPKKVKKAIAKKPTEVKFFGFKVVVKEGNKLVSCTSAGLKVQYVSDKFVSPRRWGGPLTVFESKWLAAGFVEKILSSRDESSIRVYRCEYIPTKVEHVFRYRIESSKGLPPGLVSKHVTELPEKTVLAKQVKLLKRVI